MVVLWRLDDVLAGRNLCKAFIRIVNIQMQCGRVWSLKIVNGWVVRRLCEHNANGTSIEHCASLAVVVCPLAHDLPAEDFHIESSRRTEIAGAVEQVLKTVGYHSGSAA